MLCTFRVCSSTGRRQRSGWWTVGRDSHSWRGRDRRTPGVPTRCRARTQPGPGENPSSPPPTTSSRNSCQAGANWPGEGDHTPLSSATQISFPNIHLVPPQRGLTLVTVGQARTRTRPPPPVAFQSKSAEPLSHSNADENPSPPPARSTTNCHTTPPVEDTSPLVHYPNHSNLCDTVRAMNHSPAGISTQRDEITQFSSLPSPAQPASRRGVRWKHPPQLFQWAHSLSPPHPTQTSVASCSAFTLPAPGDKHSRLLKLHLRTTHLPSKQRVSGVAGEVLQLQTALARPIKTHFTKRLRWDTLTPTPSHLLISSPLGPEMGTNRWHKEGHQIKRTANTVSHRHHPGTPEQQKETSSTGRESQGDINNPLMGVRLKKEFSTRRKTRAHV